FEAFEHRARYLDGRQALRVFEQAKFVFRTCLRDGKRYVESPDCSERFEFLADETTVFADFELWQVERGPRRERCLVERQEQVVEDDQKRRLVAWEFRVGLLDCASNVSVRRDPVRLCSAGDVLRLAEARISTLGKLLDLRLPARALDLDERGSAV